MKAYSIDPQTHSVEAINIHLEANTVYSFFNSILIDESQTLTKHAMYSDANALSEGKKPFFFGGQIIVGKLLIIGKEDFQDAEATIPQSELELLVDYNVNQFYTDVLEALRQTDINLYRTFIVPKGAENITLNIEWVLYTFNIADERTKEYFLTELNKAIENNENIEEYMKKMATLAVKAAG